MEALGKFDLAVEQGLTGVRSPAFQNVLGFVTHLGDDPVLLPVAAGAAGWLLWHRRFKSALLLVAAAVLGAGLVEVSKELIQRPRPTFVAAWYDPTRSSHSYPSGHAFNSMAIYLLTALLIGSRWSPRARRGLIVAALTLSFIVGLTRLGLGVHWLTDVLGGWLGGAGWALLWWQWDEP